MKKEIKNWEKEFDEEFLSNARIGNEQIGFWWALNTNNPEDIKSFISKTRQDAIEEAVGKIKLKRKMNLLTVEGSWASKRYEGYNKAIADLEELKRIILKGRKLKKK